MFQPVTHLFFCFFSSLELYLDVKRQLQGYRLQKISSWMSRSSILFFLFSGAYDLDIKSNVILILLQRPRR